MAKTTTDISHHIWEAKYRYVDRRHAERTISDTWRRVARALAVIEQDLTGWEEKFFAILGDFKFLPGGRIQAGAGVPRNVRCSIALLWGRSKIPFPAFSAPSRKRR